MATSKKKAETRKATSTTPKAQAAPHPAASDARSAPAAWGTRSRQPKPVYGLRQPLPVPPPAWLTPEDSADDRRQHPRTAAEMHARLYAGDGQQTFLEARLDSVDLSLSGVFLRSSFYLPEGTSVRVEFDVEDAGQVSADGRVVRVQRNGDQTGLGIQFTRFQEGSLEALISVFIADEVCAFVERYCRDRRGVRDVPTPTGLLHAILAWELYRSSQQQAE